MNPIDPDLLLRAYAIGVFPMSDSREAGDVYWVEPRRRAILPLNGFHLSRSLKKAVRSGRFQVSRDRAFADVLRRCADRDETWINGAIERGYNLLHSSGHAHSIEVRQDGELVGGLYGVKLGRAFFGESMFSSRPDASKVALAWLVARLKAGGYTLLDCQFMTDHLRSLGAVEIEQKNYLALLESALGGAEAVRAGAAERAEFAALDRLLAAGEAAGVPDGWVIAQLLGQTS